MRNNAKTELGLSLSKTNASKQTHPNHTVGQENGHQGAHQNGHQTKPSHIAQGNAPGSNQHQPRPAKTSQSQHLNHDKEARVPTLTERHALALENHARALDRQAQSHLQRTLADPATASQVIPPAWHAEVRDHALRRQIADLGGLLP